MHKPA